MQRANVQSEDPLREERDHSSYGRGIEGEEEGLPHGGTTQVK